MTSPRLVGSLPRIVAIGTFALAALTAASTTHCGDGASCESVCDNYLDKCYADATFGGDLEKVAFNDCLEQCLSRAEAVPDRCAAQRDELLACIADAPSVDCDDAQRSAACKTENERLSQCDGPTANGEDGSNGTGGGSPNGTSCAQDDECESGICNEKLNQCASLGEVGAPCAFGDECTTNLCNRKLDQCAVPGPAGSPCVFDAECASNQCASPNDTCV